MPREAYHETAQFEQKVADKKAQIKAYKRKEKTGKKVRVENQKLKVDHCKIKKKAGETQAKMASLRASNKNMRKREMGAKKSLGKAKEVIAAHAAAIKKVGAEYRQSLKKLAKQAAKQQKAADKKTKHKGRYTPEMRQMCYQFMKRGVSMRALPHVIAAAFAFANITSVQIPSQTTLRNMLTEMDLLSTLHVATEYKDHSNMGIAFDGSMRDGQALQVLDVIFPGKTMTLGVHALKGKDAESNLEGIQDRFDEMRRLAAMYEGNSDGITLTKLCQGENGGMCPSDHAASEELTKTKIENLIREELMEFEWFREKSIDEQDAYVKIQRAYCYQHKIDNLSKACFGEAFKSLRAMYGVDEGEVRGVRTVCANQYVYAAHKLVAGCSKSQDLSIHDEFKAFLTNIILCEDSSEEEIQDAEMALKILAMAGPLPGSRFWATHKNAAVWSYLRKSVGAFLNQRYQVMLRTPGMEENKLHQAVREQSSMLIIKIELAAAALEYFAILRPALMSVVEIDTQATASREIQDIQAYLEKGLDVSKEEGRIGSKGDNFIRKVVMGNDGSGTPSSYKTQEQHERLCPLPEVTRYIYEDLTYCLETQGEIAKGVFLALKLSFAAMVKVQRNMSPDMLHGLPPKKFVSRPSTVTWLNPCASTGHRYQINTAQPPDNISNERAFAATDKTGDRCSGGRFDINKRSGMYSYGVNDTAAWLNDLSPEDRARIFKICTSAKAVRQREATLRNAEVERQNAIREKQRGDREAVQAKALHQREIICKATDETIVWRSPECATHLEELLASTDKTCAEKKAVIKEQFAALAACVDPRNSGIVGTTIPVSGKDIGAFKPKGDGLTAWADALPILLASPEVATILAAVSSMPPASGADGMEVVPTPEEIRMANWQHVCREIQAGQKCKSILDSASGHLVRSKQHREQEKASKERKAKEAKEAKAIEEAAQAEANPAAGQGDGPEGLPAGKPQKKKKNKASNPLSP